jgi:hypothetical protein
LRHRASNSDANDQSSLANKPDASIVDKATRESFNGLKEALFILDEERRIVFANQMARSIFGYIVPSSDIVRTKRHPKCRVRIDQALQGQQSGTKTITIKYPVSTTFNVLATRISAQDSSGKGSFSLCRNWKPTPLLLEFSAAAFWTRTQTRFREA